MEACGVASVACLNSKRPLLGTVLFCQQLSSLREESLKNIKPTFREDSYYSLFFIWTYPILISYFFFSFLNLEDFRVNRMKLAGKHATGT